MDHVTQDLLKKYDSSIDAVQKHVDDLKGMSQQIKKNYADIDAALAANDMIAYSEAITCLNMHRQQLTGIFFELGTDAIGYHNGLGGEPQRQVV